MNIEFDDRDGVLVATPRLRRLDAIAAADFRRVMIEQCSGRPLVVVCVADVQFVDSSGLSAIVGVLKCLAKGGSIRLVDVSDNLQRLLRLTRLHDVFGAYPSVTAAVGAFGAGAA